MVRVAVLGSDYFQNKRDVTRMRCTRKSLNCTAHAIDDQNNGRWVSANQPMIEHRPHAIQLYLDQWGTRPTPPSLASVVHTVEAVAGSWGSVSAPAVSRVMGGAPERNKN